MGLVAGSSRGSRSIRASGCEVTDRVGRKQHGSGRRKRGVNGIIEGNGERVEVTEEE